VPREIEIERSELGEKMVLEHKNFEPAPWNASFFTVFMLIVRELWPHFLSCSVRIVIKW
jgi:hypothetical protein